MSTRLVLLLTGFTLTTSALLACCPAPPPGKPVVNADQTVLIIWDEAQKTQHFIRQASFKSAADDFGFLVPTPTQPEVAEAGDGAFPYLAKLTAPEVIQQPRPVNFSCGCGATKSAPGLAAGGRGPEVRVLEEKRIGDFHAAVLEADAPDVLSQWLRDRGYNVSPEIEAWVKPYVEAKWKVTAFKVVKDRESKEKKDVAASAVRLSFKTDRPLFPYREPDYKNTTAAVGIDRRLLRIFLVADARFQGELTKDTSWTGKVAWSNKMTPEARTKLLEELKLPADTGPAQWWLTEFEDNWPLRPAVADVYFGRDRDQSTHKRPPIIVYAAATWPTDFMVYAIAAVVFLPSLVRRARRR